VQRDGDRGLADILHAHQRLVDELVRHPLPTNVRQLDALLVEVIAACNEGEGNVLRLPKGGFVTSAGAAAAVVQPAQRGAGGAKGAQGGAAAAGEPGREELVKWLEEEKGMMARVARRAGMERTAVYRLMERYGIDRKGRG